MKSTRILAIVAGVAAMLAVAQPAAASDTATASQSATAARGAAPLTTSPLVSGQPAGASKNAAAARACGFVGGETYRHCSTWTHVYIDAQNIWGKTYRNICVGPGDTHLGYLDYWVISYAWYIGKRC